MNSWEEYFTCKLIRGAATKKLKLFRRRWRTLCDGAGV